MKYRKIISLVILILFIVRLAFAQDSLIEGNFPPPLIPPRVYAIEAKEAIIVDGKLNEATWQQAPVIKDFFRTEPRQGGKYFYETIVRIVSDKKRF